jgi:hypothetical protein
MKNAGKRDEQLREGGSGPSAPIGADEAADLWRRVRELEEVVRRLSEGSRSGAWRTFLGTRSWPVRIGAAALLLANHRGDTAEISNATGTCKALIVVGNGSGQVDCRQVRIDDI